MRAITLFTVLVTSYLAIFAYGDDFCSSVQCPEGRQDVDVCFFNPINTSGPIGYFANFNACGYSSEKMPAEDLDGLRSNFKKLNSECKKIRRLSLDGHGRPGWSEVGNIYPGDFIHLKEFSCLFVPGAQVYANGCNVGKSCEGGLFTYAISSNLLVNGGIAFAPLTYALSLVGTAPGISLNYRKIISQPQSSIPFLFRQSGLIKGNGQNLNHECGDRITQLVSQLDTVATNAEARGCSANLARDFDLLRDDLELAMHLKSNPNFIQQSSENFKRVEIAVYYLKAIINSTQSCDAN